MTSNGVEGFFQADAGVWWIAISSSVAAAVVVWGALRGDSVNLRWAIRIPRMLLGGSAVVVAASYWVTIAYGGDVGQRMREGAGWVLWPAMAWTAWAGFACSRRVVDDPVELDDKEEAGT